MLPTKQDSPEWINDRVDFYTRSSAMYRRWVDIVIANIECPEEGQDIEWLKQLLIGWRETLASRQVDLYEWLKKRDAMSRNEDE